MRQGEGHPTFSRSFSCWRALPTTAFLEAAFPCTDTRPGSSAANWSACSPITSLCSTTSGCSRYLHACDVSLSLGMLQGCTLALPVLLQLPSCSATSSRSRIGTLQDGAEVNQLLLMTSDDFCGRTRLSLRGTTLRALRQCPSCSAPPGGSPARGASSQQGCPHAPGTPPLAQRRCSGRCQSGSWSPLASHCRLRAISVRQTSLHAHTLVTRHASVIRKRA